MLGTKSDLLSSDLEQEQSVGGLHIANNLIALFFDQRAQLKPQAHGQFTLLIISDVPIK